MADQEGEKKLTISEVEEVVNEWAVKWARDYHNLPLTAFRVFLWPSNDFTAKVVGGPTAKIILGSAACPGGPEFPDALKRAVDLVARQRLYSTMAIELVAHVLERDSSMRRWLKERYNFDPELIPHMLGDEELSIRQVERIEVVHKPTGLREVVEVEPGANRSTYAAREIAKMRLARRVNEKRIAEKEAKVLPFPQSA